MKPLLAMLCAALCLVTPAASAGPPTEGSAIAVAPAARPPAVARPSAVARPRPAAARATGTPRAVASKSGASAGMPRTLSDVHIEGEIPVPQVLFITARDQRRFMEFDHHRYLRSSAQIGEATPFPTWVGVVTVPPVEPRKETSR